MGLFRSPIGGTLKTMIDVPTWMGWSQIKANTITLKHLIKFLFYAPKSTRKETFEQAVRRLNLTETDLQKRKKTFLRLTLFYLLLSFLCLAYTFHLFYHRYLIAGFIASMVSSAIFIKAFIMHFWYFQIKHRKLGCTIREWLQGHVKETK